MNTLSYMANSNTQENVIADSWMVVLRKPTSADGLDATNVKGEPVLSATQLDDFAATYNGKVKRVFHNAIYGISVTMSDENSQRMSEDPIVSYIERDAMATIS